MGQTIWILSLAVIRASAEGFPPVADNTQPSTSESRGTYDLPADATVGWWAQRIEASEDLGAPRGDGGGEEVVRTGDGGGFATHEACTREL